MPNAVDLWVSSAEADFQAAAHEGAKTDFKCAVHYGACIADLPLVCCRIEDMVQSIALGLNELTEALRLMNNRIDEIDEWVHAQQAAQEGQRTEQPSPALSMT
ncbi:MAG: hypothetical protein ABSF62_20725 [Bryobacteraceae bacterium]|jgi:hypothetical protein